MVEENKLAIRQARGRRDEHRRELLDRAATHALVHEGLDRLAATGAPGEHAPFEETGDLHLVREILELARAHARGV